MEIIGFIYVPISRGAARNQERPTPGPGIVRGILIPIFLPVAYWDRVCVVDIVGRDFGNVGLFKSRVSERRIVFGVFGHGLMDGF